MCLSDNSLLALSYRARMQIMSSTDAGSVPGKQSNYEFCELKPRTVLYVPNVSLNWVWLPEILTEIQ